MSNILILNGHQPYPFAKGELNASFVARAEKILTNAGHEVRVSRVADGYDVDQEIENHR